MKKSKKTHAVIDMSHGMRKSRKILAAIKRFIDPGTAISLDIGTGSGVIASLLSKELKRLVSVDVNDERIVKEGYRFKRCEDARLPFPDRSFDLVISNHVIEHISDQETHVKEIHRVLRPGGFCYLATPNRWWFMETHFRIPMLSWLPNEWAGAVTKTLFGRVYDIYPLSWRDLRGLTDRFRTHDVSAMVIKEPKRFRLDILPGLQPLTRRLPLSIIRQLSFIYPSFLLMLEKRRD